MNNPTRYEVIVESADGCSRKAVGFIERNSRHGIRDFVRGETAHAIMVAFGGREVAYAKRAADGFVIEDAQGEPVAAIRFSGRTERDAVSEGRLPMFGTLCHDCNDTGFQAFGLNASIPCRNPKHESKGAA